MAPTVVLAMATLYDSPFAPRFSYTQHTMANARVHGYRVIVADGSPSPAVRDFFMRRSTECLVQKPGLAFAHEQVIDAAATRYAGPGGFIFYTEPEKWDIIRHIPTIMAPIIEGRADVSLPVRTDVSWKSYPVVQQLSEQLGGQIISDMTNKAIVDFHPGPMGLTFEAVQFLKRFFERWCAIRNGVPGNWDFILLGRLAAALSRELRIANIPVDFMLDPAMKAEEEGNMELNFKRIEQLSTLMRSAREVQAMYVR